MNVKRLILMVINGFLLALILTGCRSLYSLPPSVDKVNIIVIQYEDDINTINAYLKIQSFNSIQINDSDGTMYADFSKISIEDPSVVNSIKVLMENGCKKIGKSKQNNSIYYETWSRIADEADCGFVFSINSDEKPMVEFQTELIPLSNTEGFYYLAEYEKWRLNK